LTLSVTLQHCCLELSWHDSYHRSLHYHFLHVCSGSNHHDDQCKCLLEWFSRWNLLSGLFIGLFALFSLLLQPSMSLWQNYGQGRIWSLLDSLNLYCCCYRYLYQGAQQYIQLASHFLFGINHFLITAKGSSGWCHSSIWGLCSVYCSCTSHRVAHGLWSEANIWSQTSSLDSYIGFHALCCGVFSLRHCAVDLGVP